MRTNRSMARSVSRRFEIDNSIMTPKRVSMRNPCRVLVVEDDSLVRARLEALLYGSNYAVDLAATAQDALRILKRTRCHIVLTDWQMPGMDGIAFCRQVRHTTLSEQVYLLMLTVRDTPDDRSVAFAAGVDDYVVKGVTGHELLERLEIGRRSVLTAHGPLALSANPPDGVWPAPVTAASEPLALEPDEIDCLLQYSSRSRQSEVTVVVADEPQNSGIARLLD